MPAATHQYNAYVFSSTGRPQYGESAVYEADRNGRPKRRRVRYTVTQWFLEPSFADNQARYRTLLAALATPEGVLLINDENGNPLVNRRVRVLTADLPEQWGQNMAEVKVAFEGVEEIEGATVFDAVFTPTGGGAVTLAKVDRWQQRINTDRPTRLVNNRRESIETVVASGVLRADPDDTPAERLAALQAAAAAMRACDAKEGVLVFADFTATMRVESIDADLGDGSDELRWSLTASATKFPTGTYAEAEFEVRQRDNLDASERVTQVAGVIRATDESGATAKRDAIAATYGTGRMLLESSFDKRRLDGADGAADAREWNFSLSYREILPGAVASWTVTRADRTDYATGIITTSISGRVSAANSGAAVAKAAELGANAYPVKVSDELTVGGRSAGGAAEQFTEVTFSYVYHRRGSEKHAEVTADTSRDHFGASTLTVSGTAAADTEANALTLARTYIPAGVLLSNKETVGTGYHGDPGDPAAALFRTVNFAYSAALAQTSGTLDYGVSTVDDYEARKVMVTYTGTARAANAEAADTLIDLLVTGQAGSLLRRERTTRNRTNTTTVFLQRDFTYVYQQVMGGAGTEVMQAELSLEDTFSVNAAVLTPIPYATAHIQTNVGTTIGMRVISGFIVAAGAATCTGWARAFKAAHGTGGYADPPRERMTQQFLPRSTTDISAYRLEFSYPYKFTNLVG